MFKLTWEQAVEAMRNGAKVQQSCFTSDEWFEMNNGVIECENGYNMTRWNRGEEWQQSGWRVLEEAK